MFAAIGHGQSPIFGRGLIGNWILFGSDTGAVLRFLPADFH